MGKHLKSILVVLGIFLLVIFLVDKLILPSTPSKQLAYSVFYDRIVDNDIKDVKLTGSEISGRWVEVTHSAEGTITGRLGAGRIEGAVTGPGFTATFVLRERGNRQHIVIKVQGGEITEISAELARSR